MKMKDIEAADQSEEDAPKPWAELCVDFTQTTTCHGVRFLTESSRFFLRRVTWTIFLLLATATFMYLMITKLMFYFEYNKIVNVAIMYNTSMKFPAVTMCNENSFELTALNDLSMVDTIRGVRMRLENNNDEIEEEQMKNRLFKLDTNICSMSKNQAKHEIAHINNIPRYVCRDVCLDFYDSQCIGIFYNRDLRQCIVSSYVEESVSTHDTEVCDQQYTWEFYRKERVIEQYEFLCTFENNNCEYLVDSTSEKFPNKFSIFSTIISSQYESFYKDFEYNYHSLEDITLNSHTGQVLAFLNVPDQYKCKGIISTPFLNVSRMCLEFFFRKFGIIKLYKTTLTIDIIGEDLNHHRLYTISWDEEIPMWERIFFRLPSGIYKIQFKVECIISHPEKKSDENISLAPTGIAIDNLSLGRCSTFSNQQCRRYAAPALSAISATARSRYWHRRAWLPQNLPYCPCESGWFRCHSGGLCIPPRLTCNGYKDCPDGLDEVAPCSEKTQITCDFEDAFLCGYTVDGWVRNKVNTLPFYKHISKDGDQSKQGHYMAPSHKNIRRVNVAYLSSPQKTITRTSLLEYKVIHNGRFERLEVFLIYKNGYVESLRMLGKKRIRHTYWDSIKTCVPHGTYSVVFRLVFFADVKFYNENHLPGVDNVILEEGSGCSPRPWPHFPRGRGCDLQDISCYPLRKMIFPDRDSYEWVPNGKSISLELTGENAQYRSNHSNGYMLTLPAIEITRNSCLSFNVHLYSDRIEVSGVTVSISYITGGLDSILHVETDLLGNRSIEIDVPASSYDSLVVTTIVFRLDDNLKHKHPYHDVISEFYIDGISVTASSCNNVDNIDIKVPLSVEKGNSIDITTEAGYGVTHQDDGFTDDHSSMFVNEDLTTTNFINITVQDRTIPSFGGFDIITFHLSSNESVDFVTSTSHKFDNFLLECRWNGVKDEDCGLVEPVNTDLGVCYTFNANGESALSTSSTGIGLSVLLNIEQYGYMKGFTNFAGVKVFLHDQNELPMVRDLGIAVPSGVRGLLSVKYSELVSTVAPWGNCSDKPSIYYENEPYTRYRCLRTCETKGMLKACGCRDVYMQGPGEMCNVSTYLQCVKGKWQPLNTNCSCPEPCHSQRYSADVSYSQISASHSDSLLSKHNSFIEKRMLASAEVRHRIEPESFITTMKLLKNNIDTHSVLMAFIRESFLLTYKTSERIETCLEIFRRVLISDTERLGGTSMEVNKDLKLDYSNSMTTEIVDKNLSKQQEFIANLLYKHLGGSLTKNDLAKSMDELSSLLNDIDVLIEEINTKVLQPLQIFIGSEKQEQSHVYNDFGWERGTLHNNTQLYINCVPRVSKEIVSLCYPLDYKPCLRVEDFSSTEAGEVINEYYDTLMSIVDDRKKKLKAKHVDFQQAVQAYQDHLRVYMDRAENTAHMDHEFIQSNLVMLDVFYGELKYESVIHEPAYDMPSFFSDFGGYMGLLLGCSALTVLEVFDLLIYNALVKCKKKKKPQQNVAVKAHPNRKDCARRDSTRGHVGCVRGNSTRRRVWTRLRQRFKSIPAESDTVCED